MPRGHEHYALWSLSILYTCTLVFHSIFLGKRAIIIAPKRGTAIFFPITILF